MEEGEGEGERSAGAGDRKQGDEIEAGPGGLPMPPNWHELKPSKQRWLWRAMEHRAGLRDKGTLIEVGDGEEGGRGWRWRWR